MHYDELYIGQVAEIGHTITLEDLQKFAELTGDDNRLHMDADYARKTSFKKQVAHGMLGASFISTVIGTKLPGDGALWFSQSLEFLLPVRIGDTIKVVAEVIRKNDREESIELATTIYNQHKQKVTTGTAKVKIIPQTEEQTGSDEEPVEEERTAVVVGASGGIGKAVTKLLLQMNFRLLAHYNRNATQLKEIKENLEQQEQLKLIQADLTTEEGVTKLLESCHRYTGKLHALVYTPSPQVPNIDFEKLEWSDFQKQLKLHLETPFLITQQLTPLLTEGQAGVVFITTQSIELPFAKLMHYTAAKGALHAMTKAMATDLAGKKIRVNAVSPSIADTDLNADLPQKMKLLTSAKTPLKRLAEPGDIARAIVFLADSSQSGFITGETIRVNGGQIMW